MANILLSIVWVFLCLFMVQSKVHFVYQDDAPAPTRMEVAKKTASETDSKSPPRAFFVFGDSLVDSGNNNFLATPARADMPPYGIDFPSHQPTGRFSNGYNIPDLISLSIESEPTLPYLHPALNGKKLLVGANFASAGIGILNDTGIQFVAIMRMWRQFELFEQYKVRVSQLVGADKAKKLVEDSLVLISLGGNDFVNNYYLLPFTRRSRQFGMGAYVSLLITHYSKLLKTLHSLGPRRIIVTGTGPIGCAPAELALWSTDGSCATSLQEAANMFNPELIKMSDKLNQEIGSHVFITANAHALHMDFISNPQAFGFKTAKEACCGQGRYNGLGLCTPLSRLCDDRNTYVFWDAFHPTERANRLIVKMIMSGAKEMMHPYNLTTVMLLDSKA